MGMLDRFTPKPEQQEVVIDEPEQPDARSTLAAYMLADGYTAEEVDQRLAVMLPDPPASVDLTPFRQVKAVCDERMRHFGGGVAETYRQIGSLLDTALEQVEAEQRGDR